jgi:hypothetical protein
MIKPNQKVLAAHLSMQATAPKTARQVMHHPLIDASNVLMPVLTIAQTIAHKLP